YRGRAIFFARFVGVLRVAAPFVAGLTSQPARYFFPYNIAAGIVWGVAFSLLGFAAGDAWEEVHHLIGELSFALVIVVVLGGFFWLKRRRSKGEALAPAAQNALPVEQSHGESEKK